MTPVWSPVPKPLSPFSDGWSDPFRMVTVILSPNFLKIKSIFLCASVPNIAPSQISTCLWIKMMTTYFDLQKMQANNRQGALADVTIKITVILLCVLREKKKRSELSML